jgi:hypothetical protein
MQDSYTVATYKRGRLEENRYAKTLNGELDTQITASREKNGAYRYEGIVQGKKLTGTFKTRSKQGIVSDRVVARQVKEKLLTGKSQSLTFEDYSPSVNPEGTMDLTCRRDESEAGKVALTVGPLQFTGLADERGMLKRVEAPLGAHLLVEERVFESGAP